jgi:hypothetical protein
MRRQYCPTHDIPDDNRRDNVDLMLLAYGDRARDSVFFSEIGRRTGA